MKEKKSKYLGLKVIYSILSFIWGSILALLILWTGLFLYSLVFAKEYIPIFWGLTANLNLQSLGVTTKLTEDIWLGTTESSVIVINPSLGLALYSYFYFLFFFGAFGYAIFITRKIILSVIVGNPFVKANSDRIRIIGITLIAVPIILRISSYLVLNSLEIVKTKGIISFSGSFTNFSEAGLIFGLLFLVISEVFRVGLLMKEEQDLTV